jgi:hypothetical protein
LRNNVFPIFFIIAVLEYSDFSPTALTRQSNRRWLVVRQEAVAYKVS